MEILESLNPLLEQSGLTHSEFARFGLLPLLFLLGSTAGLFGSLLGLGGGWLIVPVLQFLGLKPEMSVATSLSVMVLTASFTLYRSYLAGRLPVKASLFMAFPAPLGTWLGTLALLQISNTDPSGHVLLLLYSGILVLVIARMLKGSKDAQEDFHRVPKVPLLASLGLLSGALSGLLGIGGAIVTVPILYRYGKMNLRHATAISLAPAFIAAVTGVSQHLGSNTILFSAAIPMGLGSIGGSLLGGHLLPRLKNQEIQNTFVVIAASIGLAIVLKTTGFGTAALLQLILVVGISSNWILWLGLKRKSL